MAKERQSNFELLRILCMWGVLTCHVLQNTYDIHVADLTLSNTFRVLLMNCSIVAVNCFILISGYFKINPTWKGVMRLASQISFYVALFAIVGALLSDVDIKTSLVRIIFPLSHSGLWFITAYFGLFLLAPMLNSAFENSSKVQRMLTCLALLIVDVYIGYMHQAPEVTQNGYHLIHFITIYYIGRQVSLLRVNRCKWGGGLECYSADNDRIILRENVVRPNSCTLFNAL